MRGLEVSQAWRGQQSNPRASPVRFSIVSSIKATPRWGTSIYQISTEISMPIEVAQFYIASVMLASVIAPVGGQFRGRQNQM